MNNAFCSLLFYFISHIALSQIVQVKDLSQENIARYGNLHSTKEVKVALLKNDFARSSLTNPWIVSELNDLRIDSIHLVFTAYPHQRNFDALNQKRINNLFKAFPKLSTEDSIEWKIFRQTDAHNEEDAKSLYHGFVIFYDDRPALAHGQVDSTSIAARKEYLERKLENAAMQMAGVEIGTDRSTEVILDRIGQNLDSIVIVSDWTGSMYGHTLQVLSWQVNKNAKEKVMSYIFFNDGDGKYSQLKKVGETGGIYESPTPQVYPVLRTMGYVRGRGDGGDIPENDFEALLHAQKKYPTAKSLVLIADNYSSVRDSVLMDSINIPVQVVLARLIIRDRQFPINQNYVKIALKTGGSIHSYFGDYTTKEELEALLKD
jgi:hypothetical protein